MKNFETPIMNISMFESENVATTASLNTVEETTAALATAIGAEVTEANTFTFTF
ncbi:MAG: hypothetical protein ACI38A_04165 [Candidatus Ornithomonoglobus sp.]